MKKETTPKVVKKRSLLSNPEPVAAQGNSMIANPVGSGIRAEAPELQARRNVQRNA